MDTLERVSLMKDFINAQCVEELGGVLFAGLKHIIIDFNKFNQFNPELGEFVLDEPEEALACFLAAVNQAEPKIEEVNGFTVRIRNAERYCGKQINQLRHTDIGKFISVKGMVKQKSEVRPQVTTARFECPSCSTVLSVIQLDEKSWKEPSKCGCGRKGRFKLLDKEEIDVYSMMLEEPTDLITGGTKLSQIRVLCKKGLSDPLMERLLYQGVTTEVTGILTEFQVRQQGKLTAKYDWYLDANYINVYDETFLNIKWDKSDIENFQKLAARPDWLKSLRNSIFYDIHGYNEECEGIILQMFSGVGKDRHGLKIRGNLHALLVGDPGCLGAGELVFLSDGSFKRIESFKNDFKHILNPRTSHESYKGKVINFWEYKNKPTKIITLTSGKQLTCSYEHPLNVRTKGSWQHVGRFQWVKASDIKMGDRIQVVPGFSFFSGQKLKEDYIQLPNGLGQCDEDVARLAGYLLGDGCVDEPTTGAHAGKVWRFILYINQEEKDLVPFFSKIISTHFNLEPTLRKRKLEITSSLKGRIINRTQTLNVLFVHRTTIATIFKKRKDRGVYDFILGSKKSVIASFLSGLFEADGCIFNYTNKNRSTKSTVQLKCSYERLRQDVLTLLLKFGIRARINDNNIVIRRIQDVKTFIKEIGFISKKKKKKSEEALNVLKKLDGARLQRHRRLTERVVRIKEGPIQDVYDIEVDKYHKFIANGIINHNSSKSSMLKIAQKFAPKARYVAGKGTTGVGLTAAVVKDELLSGFTLEAGALVLANNGMLMLDELDKVSNEDKEALHEPLSDETVSISKGNIQATLIAQTSVLAAANPKLGSYSEYDTIYNQIDLSPTLINRFDLVYPLKDSTLSMDDHESIAKKILSRGQEDEIIPIEHTKEFIKKYIAYARTITPIMPAEIQSYIASRYRHLKETKRIHDEQGKTSIPLTGRNVEAFRRVIEAVARSRLHGIITPEDAEIGYKKIMYSIQQVGIDPESGEVIEEVIGKPLKEKDIIARICSLLRERTGQKRGVMDIDELYAIMASEGITDTMKIDKYLSSLKEKGDIYEPLRGKLQWVT